METLSLFDKGTQCTSPSLGVHFCHNITFKRCKRFEAH
jgi:hypothetical protein